MCQTSRHYHLFTNRWLWVSLVLGVVLQIAVVELPLLQTAFGTVSLTPAQWTVAAAMASLVLWCEELRKLVMRWRAAAKQAKRAVLDVTNTPIGDGRIKVLARQYSRRYRLASVRVFRGTDGLDWRFDND